MAGIISITTDFGTKDPYVGAMKGSMLGFNPDSTLVDLTHQVDHGDVFAGALALLAACPYFPEGTVHLAVVDPGVGSARRAVAVETERYFFVGPDNGLLSLAAERDGIKKAVELKRTELFRPEISPTFHGRDVFGPAAALLSASTAIEELGPVITDMERLDFPEPSKEEGLVTGEVIYVDHFGNLVSNISEEDLTGLGPEVEVSLGGRLIGDLTDTYASVPEGIAAALVGSSGLLEVAVNLGSAEERFGAGRGTEITAAGKGKGAG